MAARADHEERERWNREQRLGREQDAALSVPVCDHPSELATEQDRRELGCKHQADEEPAMRQLQRKPWHGNALHPCADCRDDLPDEEEPVIAVPKGTQHATRRDLTHPMR